MNDGDGDLESSESTDPEWFRDYFDRTFLQIYRPLLPPDAAQEEAAAVIQALGLQRGDRVLDVGCGWGRHAVPLAAAGLRVTGLDRAEFLLREAQGTKSPDTSWVCADIREIPFRGTFQGAVSLFSSLGYFLDDREDLRALRAIREALVPGGVLLMEMTHRDLVAREYAERDWWEDDDGTRVWVERDFDAVAGISHERLLWRTADGEFGEKRHSIRIRTPSEWSALLVEAGFTPLDWFGSWELEPFSLTAERLIVVAEAAPHFGDDPGPASHFRL
jgi:SAM-dependent methyltransferase